VEIWPYLLGITVALLALSASVHAILTKRNVGSALAWVGLILLSPLVGATLYGLLGINRIHRRASALRAGTARYRRTGELPSVSGASLEAWLGPEYAHLAPIGRLGDRVVERPLLGGNLVTPLPEGDTAYPAMLRAIEEARSSVTLSTYIFDNDRAGRKFLEALTAAERRGVAVRVLIDDVGARYSFPSMARALRRAGVRVARFMPMVLHWRMPYFNLRSHRKILVVDGRIGFTGGMNIREGSWLALSPSHPVRDLHFRIEGPTVTELQEVFAEDWTFTTGERLIGEIWFPRLEPRGSTPTRGLNEGPEVDFEKLPSMILGALSCARARVDVFTPYFIPDTDLSTMLGLLAMRGVEVRIFLPEKSNLTLVQWASTAHWTPLLERGCRIFLTPPPFDHSKLLVVDEYWVLLGSANLDPRSLLLNFEFNVECFDASLAAELRGFVQGRLAEAREVTLREMRERSVPRKLRDGLARLLSPVL
jgi:cardiolipin synthase A/B